MTKQFFRLTEAERLIAVLRLHEHMLSNEVSIKNKRDKISNDLSGIMLKFIKEDILNDAKTPPVNGIDNYIQIHCDEFITISAVAHFITDMMISFTMSRNPNNFKKGMAYFTETFVKLLTSNIENALSHAKDYEKKAMEADEEYDKLHMAGRSDANKQ